MTWGSRLQNIYLHPASNYYFLVERFQMKINFLFELAWSLYYWYAKEKIKPFQKHLL